MLFRSGEIGRSLIDSPILINKIYFSQLFIEAIADDTKLSPTPNIFNKFTLLQYIDAEVENTFLYILNLFPVLSSLISGTINKDNNILN